MIIVSRKELPGKWNTPNCKAVNQCIQEAAQRTAASDLLAPVIERFLRTGEKTWDGAGSGGFSLAQFTQDEVYTGAAKTAL